MLAANAITKSHKHQTALRGVDIEIASGEIKVVTGPSGAGKSTLLRALSLLDPPDSGVVCIDGERYNFPKDRFRKMHPWPKITVVFQQHFLWPHLTIRENVLLPVQDCPSGNDTRDLERITETLGIKPLFNRYPNEVSQGERQRTAIARAIMLKPRYLLLDEITSALDSAQIVLMEQILSTLKHQNVGMLVITHDLQFAESIADTVLVMENGVMKPSLVPLHCTSGI